MTKQKHIKDNGILIYHILALAILLLMGPMIISADQMPPDRLLINTTIDSKSGQQISKGIYHVFENRSQQKGKILKLEFTILHARSDTPAPEPVFLLAGGPGVAAGIYEPAMKDSPILNNRDIVMVNLRGTAGNNRLHCDFSADRNLQGYLDSAFLLPLLKKCLWHLSAEFDLTQYSNPIAVDDLDEIRQALGYRQINLIGFSGGTRVALVYMKRHPKSIRSAILNGVVPFSFKNPLYHASASHASLKKLFKECRDNPQYQKAFPNLEKEFYRILDRLKKKPARVIITHPKTKKPTEIILHRNNFADAVRLMLYRLNNNRRLPYLIHQAYEGHFTPFAELAVNNYQHLHQILSMGLLLCVTCAEDVDRISEEEIIRETRQTFLGDVRVREQKAACAIWPRSMLSPGYTNPVTADIPVLLLSGTLDPVTPPRLSEALDRQLPRTLHLVVPGTHGVGGKCLTKIQLDFLKTASFKNLDTSCIKEITLPPLFIPKKEE